MSGILEFCDQNLSQWTLSMSTCCLYLLEKLFEASIMMSRGPRASWVIGLISFGWFWGKENDNQRKIHSRHLKTSSSCKWCPCLDSSPRHWASYRKLSWHSAPHLFALARDRSPTVGSLHFQLLIWDLCLHTGILPNCITSVQHSAPGSELGLTSVEPSSKRAMDLKLNC